MKKRKSLVLGNLGAGMGLGGLLAAGGLQARAKAVEVEGGGGLAG